MRFPIYISLLFLMGSCKSKEDNRYPEYKTLTESVYASILIQPDSSYQAYASVAGILERNFVVEGDLVLKNQILLQINNSVPQVTIENAKLSLQLAQQNYTGEAAVLNGIRDEMASANLRYKNDSIVYKRQENLWKQKIGSKADYDAKKLNYEVSQKNLQQLKNSYEQTKNQLQTSIKQANNSLKTSIISNKDFTIQSKINGKVYALYKEPGEIITTMEPLVSVGSASVFVIEMLVDEVDIVKIALNQSVVITLDAYKGMVFNGKVSKIYPQKDERNQTFKVEARFEKQPEVLYPGLSGEANIIISKKENVLTIPKYYLIDGTKVETDQGIVTIKTGVENMEFIEIIEGITDSTLLHKPKY
ncbi:multidrug efflux pump subunit AcrA (membrane-fusion protein) [Gelidibacter algens]|uniref:Multidrug efflux pump subunit AcrA (Membrane-fusion protein) n=1 Tax=Gelidibacter algens TaxID=49280 RepID=A0A1A7R6V5_9FLAO|nr:efflux RND transporter periplasmic adaptor subunit [Gelidibacter algens]OBX27233.1 efflux transporter periplasmic adaptor subunit [Gelidibacter algens]RAJ22094.1 multidrug efflux pump subunit AcrA (membrane-fusion protein) [Gelidibacter algens]